MVIAQTWEQDAVMVVGLRWIYRRCNSCMAEDGARYLWGIKYHGVVVGGYEVEVPKYNRGCLAGFAAGCGRNAGVRCGGFVSVRFGL